MEVIEVTEWKIDEFCSRCGTQLKWDDIENTNYCEKCAVERELIDKPINLGLQGLALDSIGKGGRCIHIDIDRETETEVIKALATIGITIESRHYNR